MKTYLLMLMVAVAVSGCTSHREYSAYRGQHKNWPTGSASHSPGKEQLPIYHGLPEKPYRVIGTVSHPHDPISEQAAAQLAKRYGGEAVLIVEPDSELASALFLATQDREPTSHPLTFKNANAGFVVEEKTGLTSNLPSKHSGKVAVVISWLP